MPEEAGFGKYDSLLDEEYEGDVSGLYDEAGTDRAPGLDCPMNAVLQVRELVRGVSQNPQTEVKDFARAEFDIEHILKKSAPVEPWNDHSKMREGGRVGDFDRLPSHPQTANFREKKGLANACMRTAAIIGCLPEDVDMDLLDQAHEDDGALLKGLHVGVNVQPDKWVDNNEVPKGTPWKEAPRDHKGVAYRPDYYPVNEQTLERAKAKPIAEVDKF